VPPAPRESTDDLAAAPTQHPEHPPLKHIWTSDQPMGVRIRQIVAHPSSVKLIKYASVSVISTIVSQVTLFMTFGVWRVMSEVPANLLANAIATIPSYYLNRKWVWGKGGRSHWFREVVPFWVISFIGLAFSSLAVYLAGDFARHHHYGHATTTLLVNGANLLSFALLWVVKFVIYNKLFHIDPVEFEEHHSEMVAAGSHDPD
jgi:putative flippase GtrA